MQGRGGRPDDGRGWEGRKKRREARADASGASAGVGGEGRVGGERRGRGRAPAPGSGASDGGRESGDLGGKGGMKQG